MTPAARGSRERRSRRSGWVTAAAAIQFLWVGVAIVYLPVTMGGGPSFGSMLMVLAGTVGLAAGIGLLRHLEWARIVAGALAAYELFIAASTLVRLLAEGAALPPDVILGGLDIGGCLVVLFAVTRRWALRTARPGEAG